MKTAQHVPLNTSSRYAHIDAMRAFAVLLVVLAHAGIGHIVPGGSGVTIFFSISGFIITFLILREKDRTGGFSARSFYTRRAIKIGPPFVLLIVVPTLVYSLWTEIDWSAFAAQIFFVYNWIYLLGDSSGVLPGSGVVWSLAIEEQFYIVFAMVWMLLIRSKRWKLALVVVASIAIVLSSAVRFILAADPLMSHRIYYGTDTRLDGIAWGVLAAVAYHSWQAHGERKTPFSRVLASDWAFVAAMLIYALSLVIRDEWFRDTVRFTLQSVAACVVIVYGLLPGSGWIRTVFYAIASWRFIQLVGLASYSIYLVHLTLTDWLREYMGDLPLLVRVVVLSAAGMAAGIAVYWLVEKPIHKYRADRLARRAALADSAPSVAVPTR